MWSHIKGGKRFAEVYEASKSEGTASDGMIKIKHVQEV